MVVDRVRLESCPTMCRKTARVISVTESLPLFLGYHGVICRQDRLDLLSQRQILSSGSTAVLQEQIVHHCDTHNHHRR